MPITPQSGALLLHVKIVANSSRTAIAGPLGDALKIKIAQPPEAGKANHALIDFLAQTLQISANNITITAGHSNPRKTLRITGITEEKLRHHLGL